MSWIQKAGSAQEALEIAKRREPQASIKVSKVEPGKYLVETKVQKYRVTSVSEKVMPLGKTVKKQVTIHKGGKTISAVVDERQLSDQQKTAFEEKAKAEYEENRLHPELLHGAYTDTATGYQYRISPDSSDKRTAVYEVINGQKVRVDDLEVKRPLPYKQEWTPYQQIRKEDLYRQWGGTSPSAEYIRKQQISRSVSSLSEEAQMDLARATMSSQVEEAAISALDTYTKPEYFASQVDIFTPHRVAIATGAKIGQWGTTTFTSLGTGAEVLARPGFYEAMGNVAESGAMPFMAGDIRRRMVQSAIDRPVEFIGEMGTSALLFWGVGKGLGKLKVGFQEYAGPKIAMATRGRLMGSLVREFEAAKPVDFLKAGRQTEVVGMKIPEYIVQRGQGRLIRGNVVMKPADYAKLVKDQGKSINIAAEAEKGYARTATEYQRFAAEPKTVKRTVYTYIKEKQPDYYEVKFPKPKITEIGSGKGIINVYEVPDLPLRQSGTLGFTFSGGPYEWSPGKLSPIYIYPKGYQLPKGYDFKVPKTGAYSYERVMFHETLHQRYPQLSENLIRAFEAKYFGKQNWMESIERNVRYRIHSPEFGGKIEKIPRGGRKAHIRTFEPVKDVKIPTDSMRYSIESTGLDFKAVEYGGADVLRKARKVPKTREKPYFSMKGEPRPMRPFSPPKEPIPDVVTSQGQQLAFKSSRQAGRNIEAAQAFYDESLYIRSDAGFIPFEATPGKMKLAPSLAIISEIDSRRDMAFAEKAAQAQKAMNLQAMSLLEEAAQRRTPELDVAKAFDLKSVQSYDFIFKELQRQAYDYMRPEPVRAATPFPIPTSETKAAKPPVFDEDFSKTKKKLDKTMKELAGYWKHPVPSPTDVFGKRRGK